MLNRSKPLKLLIISHVRFSTFLLLFLLSWLLFLLFWLPPSTPTTTKPAPPTPQTLLISDTKPSSSLLDHADSSEITTCNVNGAFFYIYDLPPEFNSDLLSHCTHLNIYTNMCPYISNRGLGQPIDAALLGGGRPNPWFSTHQFIAEMIFHARVENHPCRTRDPARATIFYVPFYGGLYASSVFRESNITARDELANKLVDYIVHQPPWRKFNGRDHFITLGRTAWDFMRGENGPDFGANALLNLPALKNMSVLTVERHPWTGSNQYGIPYPSYFHPYTPAQMYTWQNKVRRFDRPFLFSFVGGPRKGLEKAAIRDEMIRQCGESTQCELVMCENGNPKCYDPREVLGVMTRSEFCLQAPGDSFTRRSTFDAVLAGCIPVFFSEHTAYTQYQWYLPPAEEFSVFIDEKGEESKRIAQVLGTFSKGEVERMREKVIRLIPKLSYAHPNASRRGAGFEDAVDVALAALTWHVTHTLHYRT